MGEPHVRSVPTAVLLLLLAVVTAACVPRVGTSGPAALPADDRGAVLLPPGEAAPPPQGGQARVTTDLVDPRGEIGGTAGELPLPAEVAGVAETVMGRLDGAVGQVSPVSLADAPALAQAVTSPPVQLPISPQAAESRGSSLSMSVPFYTQKDGDRFQGSNCGPAALRMVLDAFGIPRGNADLRLLTHTYQGTVGARTGTALQHMAHVAADLGLEPRGLYQRPDPRYGKEGFARWTVEDVRAEVLAGRPVIPLVKFRLLPGHEDSPFRADHYVVIHGVEGDWFLYHDPIYESPWEGGAKWMTADTLAAAMKPTLVPQQAVSFAPGRRAPLTTS